MQQINSVNRKSNNFDFIRFVAASFVIITHMQALMGWGSCDALCTISQRTLQFSHLGVVVFFTISGYLIAQSLVKSQTYAGYLWKRCLRIFPGLLVVLLLSMLVLGPLVTTLTPRQYFGSIQTWEFLLTISLYKLHLNLPGVFESNPVFSSLNGSLWTLAYEFSCYLLLLIAGITGIIKKPWMLLLAWLFAFSLRAYLGDKIFVYDYGAPWLLGLNIRYCLEYGMFFLSGSLLYLYHDKIRYEFKWFLLAMMLMVGSLFISPSLGRLSHFIGIPYVVFYLSFLPGTLNRWGKYGDFSYGIYIYAYPVQQTLIYLFGLSLGLPLMTLLAFVITLPLAVLSWHLVEKRALTYKDLVK